MRPLIIIPICLISFSSCFNYKIFPKEIRSYTYSGKRQKAYVVNPALKKEYSILRSSDAFEIVSDSSDSDAVKIVLHPIKRSFVCGEPILGSLITLGQVPVLLPDRYEYSFEEIAGTRKTSRSYEMQIATQFWFWNMFVFNKKFDKKAGRVLLAKYYAGR